ncbi:hypothetical protein RI367_007385 [Sorochytrium milnesiophthora]
MLDAEAPLSISERRAMLQSNVDAAGERGSTGNLTSDKKTQPKFGGASGDCCVVCKKSVYPLEKAVADERVYHKACIRCTQCNKQLSLGNYAAIQGMFFCKPHYKQTFALKGNYNDGFGIQKHEKALNYVPGGGPASLTAATTSTTNAVAAAAAAAPAVSAVQARKPSKDLTSASPLPSDACPMCNKAVYIVDKVALDGISMHKGCFRCAQCKIQLQIGKSHKVNGAYYCRTHYQDASKA